MIQAALTARRSADSRGAGAPVEPDPARASPVLPDSTGTTALPPQSGSARAFTATEHSGDSKSTSSRQTELMGGDDRGTGPPAACPSGLPVVRNRPPDDDESGACSLTRTRGHAGAGRRGRRDTGGRPPLD